MAKVRAEDINFMARYGRGLICLTLTADSLRASCALPQMVSRNEGTAPATAFTVSIEAALGRDHRHFRIRPRAYTVQAAVEGRCASPEDLVQPGHIFPLNGASRVGC